MDDVIMVYGASWCPDCRRAKRFLGDQRISFEWHDIEVDPDGVRTVQERNDGNNIIPTIIFPDGSHLSEPSNEELAEKIGLERMATMHVYDLIIVGGGPAGLTTSIYAARENLQTLVIDSKGLGGQAGVTERLDNYPGFPEGIGGAELARLAGRQAERFGAEVMVMRGVESGSPADHEYRLHVQGGVDVTAKVVVAAAGMVWRRLEVEGLDDLVGRGVYYGAGRSEAAQCADDEVVVVGAGNSAGQAVLNLADAGARVKMLVRGEALGKTMSAYLIDRIRDHPLIDVRVRTQVSAVEASEGRLAAVATQDADGGGELYPAAALFVCIGGTPHTGWAEDVGVRLDAAGYILTGPDLLNNGQRPAGWPLDRDPLALETSVPGLFAAGDVRHGSTKRVAGAVGEGAMAAALAHRRLAELEAGD
jgi:thioredoxin reductase (NADPH)